MSGHDLRIGGLVALPARLGADERGERAVVVERDRTFLALAPGRAFDIARQADAADLAARLGGGRARREIAVGRLGERLAHRRFEIADIIGPAGRGAMGHLCRLDEVSRADLLA